LGPRYLEKFSKWEKRKINESLFLMVHPDLELNYVSDSRISLILLGFILDPYNPKHSNKDILNELIENNNKFEEIVRSTYNLGGSWIIVYKNDKFIGIFNDAAGTRQIYYSKKNSEIWCASQPHTIAEELNLQESENQDLNKFISSNLFTKSEHAWAGDGTIYDNIKHLLPNKYLDLKNGFCVRYWPDKKFEVRSIGKVITESSEILKGLLKSANNRHNLMLAVTAGIDTRVLLAASKEICMDVFYYIQKFKNLDYKSADIRVPSKLLPKLGLKFNVIECEKEIDNNFDSILKKNVSIVQSDEKKILYYNFYKNFQDKLNVGGNVSEIARNYYQTEGTITAEKLAEIFGRKSDKFTINNFEKWLDEIENIANKFGVDILDLFYWEQRMGNWGAMFGADLNIAVEQFYPFNCRRLLEELLSINKKYRKYSDNALYKGIIENLWSDTLKEPINPKKITEKLRDFIMPLFKKMHFYHLAKYGYNFLGKKDK
jgi:hypothetical protein